MSYFQIAVLGLIQGLAELLPVSSSAHVIIAEKLMGLNPSAPEMTFLLVMLHTGTMFAVIAYFWKRWQPLLLGKSHVDGMDRMSFVKGVVIATALTGIVGYGLKGVIEHVFLRGAGQGEIEDLFSNLPLIGCSLLAAGVLIIVAGRASLKGGSGPGQPLDPRRAALIGVVQGLCLPFRGFSRSGATISTGILNKMAQTSAETFSFALAVVLTPPVILREGHRLIKATAATGGVGALSAQLFIPGLFGMVCALVAGLGALKWLSQWLEHGKWHFFGFYCLAAAIVVFVIAAL